jgi:hypothetical protein
VGGFRTTRSRGVARLRQYESNPIGLTLLEEVTSPSELFLAGEPGYWLDPSYLPSMWTDSGGVTPVAASGDTIGRIIDRSPNGHVWQQATAGNRPLYNVDSNGKQSINFVSSDTLASTGTVAMASGTKLLVVVGLHRPANTSTKIPIFAGYGVAGGGGWALYDYLSANTAGFPCRGTGNSAAEAGLAGAGNVVLSWVWDTTQATTALGSELRINGRRVPWQQVVGAPGVAPSGLTNHIHYLGASSVPANYWIGRMYGLVVRAGAVTAAQRRGVENWMMQQTGGID